MNFINQQYSLNDTIEFVEFDYQVTGSAGTFRFTELKWYYYTGSRVWAFRAYRGSYALTLASWNSSRQAYVPNDEGKELIITGGSDANNPDFVAWFTANAAPAADDFIYKVHKEQLVQTANAIRKKRGTTDEMWFDEYDGFYSAISNIYIGNDTRNATAFPTDIAFGQTAFAGGNELTGTITNARGVNF